MDKKSTPSLSSYISLCSTSGSVSILRARDAEVQDAAKTKPI